MRERPSQGPKRNEDTGDHTFGNRGSAEKSAEPRLPSKLVSAFLMDERMTGMEREKAEIDVVQGLY